MKTEIDRLGGVVKRLRKAAGMTQHELASQVNGYDHGNLSRFERGQQRIAPEKLAEIAKALGTSVGEIFRAAEVGNDRWKNNVLRHGSDAMYLPFIIENPDPAKPDIITSDRQYRFSAEDLEKRGIDPASCAVVEIVGDSMRPILPDGAIVAIDQSNSVLRQGHVYALNHRGMLRVSRVHSNPDSVTLVHANPEFPQESHPSEDVLILGRAFWYSAFI